MCFRTEKYSIIQSHLFLAWPIKTVCESEKQNFVTAHLSVRNCIHTCLPGPANPRGQRNSMESIEYAVSICLRTTYKGSDCSMGSCTQKGIAAPYSPLLMFTAVVVFSRISYLGITVVMRQPLNLSFLLLNNEGNFLAKSPGSRLVGDFLVSCQPAVTSTKVSCQPAGRRPKSLLPASYQNTNK